MAEEDKKIRCALVHRIEESGGADATAPTNNVVVVLAKHDHAAQYETHGGAARDETTLYGTRDKAYAEAVSSVLEQDALPGGGGNAGLSTIGRFRVVQSERHQLIYGSDSDGICVSVITGRGYPFRTATAMIQEIYQEFISKYGHDGAKEAKALGLNDRKILSDACKKYDDLKQVEKTAAIMEQIEHVQAVMHDNIAAQLDNMESGEKLEIKSEELSRQAQDFHRQSRTLKSRMKWKDIRMTLILLAIVAVILILVLVPVLRLAK